MLNLKTVKTCFITLFMLLFFFSLNAYSQEELSKLQSGNDRYVSGHTSQKDFLRERDELVSGQKPYAIVLTCSDSRVPPEYIFDESLGQLFVIRDAGNVVNFDVLGSIEYAVEHLHSKMLIVMGHENCGAVKAALEGGKVPPNIGGILFKIKPAIKSAKAKKLNKEETLNKAIEDNVENQVKEIFEKSKIVKEAYEKGELKIYSAIYSLHTGKVNFEEFKEK
jgi:carbonic anhydrase